MTHYHLFESPLGQLVLTARKNALTGVYFADRPHAPEIDSDWVLAENAEIFSRTERQLREYAAGGRESFDLPLFVEGTDFQRRVWREIASIPFAETVTYGEIARRIGSPAAVRAVGTATGQNPISWIVPCHRVVGKNGVLTGYAGGVERKRALLDFETGRGSVPGLERHSLCELAAA
jgi:methylated-DNA-[protein]-cysteine S-methyltransferase